MYTPHLNARLRECRREFQNRSKATRMEGARFEIRNKSSAAAEIYIYGDIAWYDISAQMVAEVLNDLSAKTLTVRMNSGGGEVFDGVAIYNLLRNYAKKNAAKIVVEIDALAASIASVIAMAGDEIVMAKNAQMMIHRAWAGCLGDAEDMAAMARLLESIENDMIVPTYAARTKIRTADLMAMMKAETWMNAQTAVDKGFASRVAAENGVEALLRPGMFGNAPSATNLARMKTRTASLNLELQADAPRDALSTKVAAMRRRMAALSSGA